MCRFFRFICCNWILIALIETILCKKCMRIALTHIENAYCGFPHLLYFVLFLHLFLNLIMDAQLNNNENIYFGFEHAHTHALYSF